MQGTLHGLKRRMKEGRVLKDGEERRGDTEDLEAPWRRQHRQPGGVASPEAQDQAVLV